MVSIHLIVKDGEKYIRKCLEAALTQNFKNYEVLVFDNKSEDKTRDIIRSDFPQVKLIEFPKNYGLGAGFNRSLAYSDSKYSVLLCVDVILAPNFLTEALKILEQDSKIGALQPKVMRWDFQNENFLDIIDTTGFEIFKSRRIINRGHGEIDKGQYEKEEEVFSYEGACPIFRRQALEDIKLKTPYGEEYLDEDFEWYADDIDLGWRMRLLGWKSYYAPKVIAWHDRQTTKSLSKTWFDFLKIRKELPARKKMLDYRNQRLAMVKNELFWNFLKDLPYFLFREIQLLTYFIFFERSSLLAIPDFFKLLPKMLEKRKLIMAKRKVSAQDIARWFQS